MEFDGYSCWRLQRIPRDGSCGNALCDQHGAPQGRTYRRRLAGDGPSRYGPATGHDAEIRDAAPDGEGDRLHDPPEGPLVTKAEREGVSEPLSCGGSAVGFGAVGSAGPPSGGAD